MDLYTKQADAMTYDNLFAGTSIPVETKAVTLAAAQGTLARGTVLGKSPVNNQYYKVNSAAEPVVKRTLAITGTTTKTATLAMAGLTLTGLKVRALDENGVLAEAGEAKDYTAAYAEETLTITMVAGGKLVALAQCYIEVNKAASGADIADCILTDEADTGDEEATDTVVAVAYSSGLFNRKALVFGGTDDAADHEERLRELGIILKDNIAY